MGWLRTNWLDALIFLLVAAIMAGVVFFLVGVNPFGGSQGGQVPPSAVAPPPQPAQPQTPTTPPPQPRTSTPQTTTPRPSITPTPTPSKPQSPSAEQPAPSQEPETVVTVLPVPQAPVSAPPAAKPVPAPPRIESKPSQPAQPEAARPAPRPERPILTADAGGSWRIATGSFSNRENAERLAATLRQQGYPVSLEASGDFTRVWVGPYSSQTRARAVADTLAQYQPQISRIAASAPPTPQAQPQAAMPTVTGRYLQVGAFRNAQSAQAVVRMVQQAGYPVVLVEEGGWVKVRVGPLEDADTAGAALRAKGLEVLEVR